MKYYPKLIGEKVYLSPICLDDAALYCQWLNDMDIVKNLVISHMIFNVEAEQEALKRLAAVSDTNKVMAIIDKETHTLIGNCGLHGIDLVNRNAEFGILIGDKNYHSKGYGSDAARLILDFGFNILNLKNVFLKAYSYNQRAVKSYEKAGFKHIGVRRQSKYFAGKYHDEIFMDILAEEFESPYVCQQLDL